MLIIQVIYLNNEKCNDLKILFGPCESKTKADALFGDMLLQIKTKRT